MSNVFTKAKQLRKLHPNKSWQQLVKMASKKTSKKKTAKKVGAYKVIEKNETKSTPAKKVVRTVRTKKGTFKGYQRVSGLKKHTDTNSHNVVVSVGSIKKTYEHKLQSALWKHEKANTVKATKAAAADIRKYRSLLKKL